jgi:hypothetical protein
MQGLPRLLLAVACAWLHVAAAQFRHADAYTRYDGRPMLLFPSVSEDELRRYCHQPIFIDEIYVRGGLDYGVNGTASAPSVATVAVLSDADFRTVREQGIGYTVVTSDLGGSMRSRETPGRSENASGPSAADGRRAISVRSDYATPQNLLTL